jgi:hypothetical protein
MQDTQLTIIGHIQDGRFTADHAFKDGLNPIGHRAIVIQVNSRIPGSRIGIIGRNRALGNAVNPDLVLNRPSPGIGAPATIGRPGPNYIFTLGLVERQAYAWPWVGGG